MKVKAVIMAGGVGTRLWPLSRALQPKQFIKMHSNISLFQQTLQRNRHFDELIVVTGERYIPIVKQQIQEISPELPYRLIIESEGCGTAICGLVASLICDPTDIIILLPSDHYIDDPQSYDESLDMAITFSNTHERYIITFGIVPSCPHTGFGYVRTTNLLDSNVLAVSHFTEKPSLDDATEYIKDPNYFWNSGIFVFRAGALLALAETITPNLAQNVRKAMSDKSSKEIFVDPAKHKLPYCSIDKTFMERAPYVALVKARFIWKDLGDWLSMWDVAAKDHNENLLIGDVITNDVKNSYVLSEDRLTAIVGVDNIIVVNTKDATLVVDRNNTQRVREIVSNLNDNCRPEATNPIEVHDSWGKYKILSQENGCIVTSITIYPGQKVPLADYSHLGSKVVIVKGNAELCDGFSRTSIDANDSLLVSEDKTYTIYNSTNAEISLLAIKA